MAHDCPPPVPPEDLNCSLDYFDWIIIPYAEILQDWLDGDINCAEFIARVIDLAVKYEGACGSSS